MAGQRGRKSLRLVALGVAGVLAYTWSGASAFVSCRVKQTREIDAIQMQAAGIYGPGKTKEFWYYYYPKNRDVDFVNDVGYLPDGTPFNTVGNAGVRPPSPDPHTPGSPLPPSFYVNDVGYLPDGTAFNKVGNAAVRPPSPDPHTEGSPLPEGEFVNSVGYLPDGTPFNTVGNAAVRPPSPDPHTPGSPLPRPRRR
eukprot:TRINITY_DN81673_c0_g1_i1.p1 TRINITY_DN81673_c0_g1~~TRINITY_DN81673_c0_g1_i1.p1  ORF type:complete len:196 (-),score=22.16 TRINITY_DN81673_c0_g1_i1:250-837(-)